MNTSNARNESVYQMDIQIDLKRPQSGSHHPMMMDANPLFNQMSQRSKLDKIISEDQESAANSEDMIYQVFDTEEQKYIDIRDIEKDIYVTDSVSYFDKRQAL
jgi:hypothetical protein